MTTPLLRRDGRTRKMLNRLGFGSFLLPLTLFMLLVFCLPLIGVIRTSICDGDCSLVAYSDFATGKLFHRALTNTLSIGFITGLVSVTCGYFVAYHLSRMTARRRRLFLVLVMLPFWTSILVKSFAFTVILGTDGIINNALQAVTGTDIVIPMIFNRAGVIIGMAHWLIPFAVFPILSSLLSQDKALRDAAEIMGARPWDIFWKVTFPLSLPGVIAGGLMSSVIGMGSFVTPALLGGRRDMMMANLVDFYVREALDWRMASAIAVILVLIALLILSLAAWLRQRQERGAVA
ncbi:ABC transporter permease [Rhodobium gokarnense]|uniref:ABC-type spermidine/putrescine transport system permease subunit I n=1 Tax=Rhodobium gokarnense TaxID=364296 RepID=A0ABT3HG51_9HYPH|nr:ABC transporter permease [Rhodobium gokarnense]MCW2309373.1 ABC-type spermidine/putrescine transport system permease subunit I [Rhodobium gokarnense]